MLRALNDTEVTKRVAQLKLLKDNYEQVSWLEERTTAQFPGGSNVMHLTVRCTDKVAATTLADAIVDVYLTEVVDAESQAGRQRLEDLKKGATGMEERVGKGKTGNCSHECNRMAIGTAVDSRSPNRQLLRNIRPSFNNSLRCSPRFRVSGPGKSWVIKRRRLTLLKPR